MYRLQIDFLLTDFDEHTVILTQYMAGRKYSSLSLLSKFQLMCSRHMDEALKDILSPEDNFGFRLRQGLSLSYNDIMR